MAPNQENTTNKTDIYHIRWYKLINGAVHNIDCSIETSLAQLEELIKELGISLETQETIEEKKPSDNIIATLKINNITLYQSHQDVAKAAYNLMILWFPLAKITNINKPLSLAQSDRLIKKLEETLQTTQYQTTTEDKIQEKNTNKASNDENNQIVTPSNHNNESQNQDKQESWNTNARLDTIQKREETNDQKEDTNSQDQTEMTLEDLSNKQVHDPTTEKQINSDTGTTPSEESSNNQTLSPQTTNQTPVTESTTNNTNWNQVAENLIIDIQAFIEKAKECPWLNIAYLQEQQQQLKNQLTAKETIQQRQIETLMQHMEQSELDLIKRQQQEEITQDIKTGNFKQEQKTNQYTSEISEAWSTWGETPEKKGLWSFLTHTIKRTIIIATLESGLITYRYMLQQQWLEQWPSAMIILWRIGLWYSGRTVVKKNKKIPIQILALVLTIAIVYLIITQIQKQF